MIGQCSSIEELPVVCACECVILKICLKMVLDIKLHVFVFCYDVPLNCLIPIV